MKSILIVEDDKIIVLNTRNILHHLGYKKVYVANSGVGALKIIEEKHPDLILADIVLDDKINGIELAKQVSAHHKIPVIFVTAYSNEKIIEEAKHSEPYGYITKPFTIDDLRIAIEIALYKFKIEKKLRESEAKLKTILHTMPSGLFTIDLNKTIKTWNKEAEIITGLKAKEVIGKFCPEILICDECKKGCLLFDDDVDKPIYHRESVIHINRREITLLKNEDVLKDPDGNNIGGIVSFIDITKRKQAEEQIITKSLFLESLIQQSPLPTFVTDSKGFNVMVNEAFLKLYAVPGKDMILGRNALTDPASVSYGMVKYFKEALKGKIVEMPDMEFVSPHENKKIIARCKMFPILDPTDTLTNVVVIQEDITERKRAEEELRKAYSQLEETQIELIQSQTLAALGGFASGIAHEIRNPLANISASAQYCIKTFDLTKKAINYLRIIIRNSNKANRIIKELLDFARPSKFVFKQGNILQPLNKTCELIRAKRLNNNIRLYKRCSKALPKILMDKKRMEQVFLNIIINSIDSMSKGGRLSIIAYLEKEYVIIEISDTGKGIPKQDISKIFNPFFTNKSNGVGLGLSVTHRIIQSHKGKIEIESKYHKGTKFTIKLPIFQDENKLFLIHDK